jgi:hypothetical protein
MTGGRPQAQRTARGPTDIERCRFARTRLNHSLELGPAIVGGGRTRLDVGFDEMIAA